MNKMEMTDLKRIINESNITIVALAEKMGVSRNAVHSWLCGRRQMNTTQLVKMADILNVSLDEMLGRSGYVKKVYVGKRGNN